MKKSLILSLMIMTLALVGCGGKDNDSGNSGSFSNALSTQEGFLNLQTQALEFGGVSYPPNQQYAMYVNQAIQQAAMNRVQPIQHNGVWKLRARVTAQIYGYNQNFNSSPYGYNQNQYNQFNQFQGQQYYQNQNTLQIQNIVFY